MLGAVLHEPLPVAGIARAMGITRQSVQRIADLLVERGLAEYVPNPAHRRAKLLRPTDDGRAAIARIDPGHAALAARLAEALGDEQFAETVRVLEQLSKAWTLGPEPKSARTTCPYPDPYARHVEVRDPRPDGPYPSGARAALSSVRARSGTGEGRTAMEQLAPGDPQHIGEYRLLARLGAGGMGQVYLARSDRGRTVAVKLVRQELAEQEEFRAPLPPGGTGRPAGRRRSGPRPSSTPTPRRAVPWVATGYVAGPALHSRRRPRPRPAARAFRPHPRLRPRARAAGHPRAPASSTATSSRPTS